MRRRKSFNGKYIKAFSLVELSIVILIIGILVGGVIQGSKLLNVFRLMTARSLTKSSPVSGIKNLVVWYETSSTESFIASEAVDGSTVSIWYDINPQTTVKNNITQSTTANKPKYYENVFGGIPSVRFDGVNDGVNGDYLSFDFSNLSNTNFTIFVVDKKVGINNNYSMFFSGSGSLILGYVGANNILFSSPGGDIYYTGDTTPGRVSKIHTFLLSSTTGKKYWLNGGKNPDSSNSSQKTLVSSSSTNNAIGSYKTAYPYGGDIAEVIMFNRDLTTEERQSIEDYLSKKYSIAISG